jgi:putative dimethyl sulfoxide reductase chaperone
LRIETLVKINEDEIIHKLAIYLFLQKFYSGELIKMDKVIWKELSELIGEEISFFTDEKMEKGIQYISQFNQKDLLELEFDFNRLFVGPNRLEASPYESTYRSTERALMQTQTMAVRRFYERAGLTVTKKNIDPDDHISLELEFVSYLLNESLVDSSHYGHYQAFLKEHLFQWMEEHCELVREKTTNALIIGISFILQGLLEVERKNLNVPRRLKK